MALLIPYDGEPRVVRPGTEAGGLSGTKRTRRAFTLAELQAIVGGYIEAIYLRSAEDLPLVMFINEDGKRMQLPLNWRATDIARQVIAWTDFVVGHAIICTPEEAGEDRPAPRKKGGRHGSPAV